MEMDNFDSSKNTARKQNSIGKTFGRVIGILGFLFLLVFIGRFFLYYRMIQKGELVNLPQFSSRLTLGKIHSPKTLKSKIELRGTDDPTLGNSKAQITIVEFADFECPYSREEFPIFREMASKYGNRVQFIYRDFPLEDIHKNARRAALAANCAGAQNKYWQMHDKIYLSADALTDADLARYGQEIGLDANIFAACLIDPLGNAEIDQDLADGVGLGVRGTPTFFINGQKIEGAIPRDVFDRLLSASLSKQ